jgi:integrase
MGAIDSLANQKPGASAEARARHRRYQLPCTTDLTLGLAARIIREAVKDRSYRATPLGLKVARYYRWKKNEWGARPDTLRDYEPILRNLCLYFADLDMDDFAPPVGTERLREAWDHYWGEKSPRTRAKVRSVWIDFFEWGVRECGLHGNPARALARPKLRDTPKETFEANFIDRALASQTYPADWCGCLLILKYAMRRSGVANTQLKHFDWDNRVLTVHTKGGRIHPLPIPDETFWARLLALKAEGLGPDSYLIYRQDSRRRRVELDEATEVLDFGDGTKQGYAWLTTRNHDQQPTGKLVHMWWYRCLERAGLVPKGTTGGTNMHRGRHTSITTLLRGTHNLKLAQLLAGHKDIRTTSEYAQLDTGDLEAALRLVYGDGGDV